MSSSSKTSENLTPTGDNVEQIREILFGGHIRAFDERFDLVEARLARESATLQKTLEKRLSELERMLAESREEASDHLGSEASNRELALNKLELALASARMDAENQMAQLQDSMATEVKTLRSELNAARKEAATALAKVEKSQTTRADKMSADKVDRSELSKMFTDIANRLQPAKAKKGK